MFNSPAKSATAGSVSESQKPNDLRDEVEFLKSQIEALKDSVKPSETHTDRRQVVFAQLHKAIFYPQLGQLPESMDTTPSSQQPKLRGLKMYATNYGLEVDLRGRTGFIPWGNVAHCAFKLLDKEQSKVADKDAGPNSAVPGYAGPSKLGTATVTAK